MKKTNKLTSRQAEVFGIIEEYYMKNMRMPTIRETSELIGLAYVGAWCHFQALVKKGYLKQDGVRYTLKVENYEIRRIS